MSSMSSLYSEVSHPFVQATKEVESIWTHASRKSTHNSSSFRRDTTTTEAYVEPTTQSALYTTDYANCWYSSSNDLPYSDYWALKGQEKASEANNCGSCASTRIKSVPASEQRFEYDRLGQLSWATYTGETFYADQAQMKVSENMSYFGGSSGATSAGIELHRYIMTLTDADRGMEFSRLQSIGWQSAPTTADADTFWAYWGWKQSGNNNTIYNRIMRADSKYRGLVFSYLERSNWSTYGGSNTYWADDVWQYLMDQDYDGKIAQKAYDDIMTYSKTERVLGFQKYLNMPKIFYTCQDQIINFTDYTDPETGGYFDPFYDVGNGTFTDIGKEFQKVDWTEAGTITLISLGYVALSIAGFFVFPPFMICLILTEGNLNDCSLGIWGNAYATDESKFSITAEPVIPENTTENTGADTFVVDNSAAAVVTTS